MDREKKHPQTKPILIRTSCFKIAIEFQLWVSSSFLFLLARRCATICSNFWCFSTLTIHFCRLILFAVWHAHVSDNCRLMSVAHVCDNLRGHKLIFWIVRQLCCWNGDTEESPLTPNCSFPHNHFTDASERRRHIHQPTKSPGPLWQVGQCEPVQWYLFPKCPKEYFLFRTLRGFVCKGFV